MGPESSSARETRLSPPGRKVLEQRLRWKSNLHRGGIESWCDSAYWGGGGGREIAETGDPCDGETSAQGRRFWRREFGGVKRIPREGEKRYQKRENFSKRNKRSPGSTRTAAGVCVITFFAASLHHFNYSKWYCFVVIIQ